MKTAKYIKLLEDYCDAKRWSENTKRSYCSLVKKFLEHHARYPNPSKIADDKILKYLLSIPGYSSRCNAHSAIKLLYKRLGHKHKLRYIPYPEKQEKLPIHVSKDEFLKIVGVCRNHKHKAILCLLFDTGLRVSEVVNLKVSDIDSVNMLINVNQSKGRKDRKVKLTQVMLAILKAYYSKYMPSEYLFEGQNKAPQYSVGSIQKIVKAYTAKAGIKKGFTPHKFRHGYAMNLLENGSNLDEIGNQLGHRSKKTTEIYARMNNKVIQKIESPLEQIMSTPTKWLRGYQH